MTVRMCFTLSRRPLRRFDSSVLFLFEFPPHFKSNSPSLTPAAPAPVAACHSEFQMAPIFPLMARRSGRQHIGEGGPTHAACSRGSIRGERGTNEWERRGEENLQECSILFFSFPFFSSYLRGCRLIQATVAWWVCSVCV